MVCNIETHVELRDKLRESHIDLYLRRNDTGRITGVTFTDHKNRCVPNGSRLGKKYSANALNENFGVILQHPALNKKLLYKKKGFNEQR